MATENKPQAQNDVASWFHKLHAVSRSATDATNESIQQRSKGKFVQIETDITAKYDQLDSNNRLSDRILTVRQWRDELKSLLRELEKTIHNLADAKAISENFLEKIANAQQVNTECLTLRDKRRGGEYVSDPVQSELIKEQKLLDTLQTELQKQVDDAFNRLCGMQAAQKAFYEDIADKEDTIHIDIDQYNKNEKSGAIGFKPYADRKPKSHLDLQSWEDLSRVTMERAHAEIAAGVATIEKLHAGVHATANKMSHQADRVAADLRLRQHEMQRAINELDAHRAPLEAEVARQFEGLKALAASKRAKEASLKLAETRLEGRLDRPGQENGEDAAQIGLMEEVTTLNQSISLLDEQIDKGRVCLNRLENELARICDELQNKREALTTDQQVADIRMQLETLPTTSQPVCPMIPQGVLRPRVEF